MKHAFRTAKEVKTDNNNIKAPCKQTSVKEQEICLIIIYVNRIFEILL